jgi:galactoside O-acetyltransferase
MIKAFLKKIRKKKPSLINSLDSYLSEKSLVIGNNTIYKKLNLIIRLKIQNKTFLTIRDDSIVSGDFIFENGKGVISIGDRTFIGGGRFISIDKIEIGSDVLISWGCTFMDNNAHSLKWSERKLDVADWKKGIEENKVGLYKNWDNVKSAPIVINDKVWIGFDVVILKGVTVGEGAIIGSRSVVTKDVPKWSIVAGNPAQVVRMIPEDER